MFTHNACPALRCCDMVLELSDDVGEARPAATAILVRRASTGHEVLLLKRSDELKHMPGLWVFPGGKVEAFDQGDNELEQARQGAARELEEEAGITLPSSSLLVFSHWLTPVVVSRRFSTWFFLTEVSLDCEVTVDGSEIVEHQWWRPAEAIRAHHGGALPLTPPTLVSLHDLEAERDASLFLTDPGHRTPPRFFPQVVQDADQMVFLYAGDVAYESGDINQPGAQHRMTGRRGIFHYCKGA